jgi:hypothetical protein
MRQASLFAAMALLAADRRAESSPREAANYYRPAFVLAELFYFLIGSVPQAYL